MHTEGLVDQLEKSYIDLKNRLDESVKQLENIKTNTISEYEKFIEAKATEFVQNSTQWNDSFKKIEKEITGLLPGALTKGLSYAYAEKKEMEEKDKMELRKSFTKGIWGLIFVSLIPFTVSVALLFMNVALEEVLLKMPRLVLAILPLYIPFLWIAYSANKKLNLCKRLIEEYSHKEVLSKTFEGLSREINNIENKNISADLRIRLLYNILEVNSENPGKLISDYNKTDHPFMDALDKSAKLTDAFKKLSKVPGLKKFAEKFATQSDTILNEQEKKVEAALESLATVSQSTNGEEVA